MNDSLQYDLSATPAVDHLETIAIQRLREHEPPEGYYLAFSGGKDSIVILELARRSGVKFDAHYSQTTVDPPEVQKFIKEHHPEVIWEKPRNSMFRLIPKKKMLPTRIIRYCCAELKEIGGRGRVVVLGVRWAESVNRRDRKVYEESRSTPGKWFLSPIIDWTDEHVWDYIHARHLPYCSLYDEGKKRIGCIMCPMQGPKGMLQDAERYPKYYRAYLNAISKLMDALAADGKSMGHGDSPEEIMYWWIHNQDTDAVTIQTELELLEPPEVDEGIETYPTHA